MYQPRHFEQADATALATLMAEHPLATLVSLQDGALTADHVPLIFDASAGPHGTLRGHVARANPLWQRCEGQPLLAVFTGVQAYVSPSWYPSKAETHQVVPTWNYAVVHAHGNLRVVHDKTWLLGLVSRLTQRHEHGRTAPWGVSDAPEEYIDKMLGAIVGIEIEVLRLEGKYKLSQNRSAADRAGVAAGLAAELGEAGALARRMASKVAP